MSGHLHPDRLGAAEIGADEVEHLRTCVRCRAERRRLLEVRPVVRLGPYEVIGLLGEGGMARVYAVRHPELRVLRAVKVLTLEGGAARDRFAREARVQRRVRDEHVLPLLDLLELDAGPALVLPLVDGPDLAAVSRAGVDPGVALALFRDLVTGVAAIHRAGLVHRDLKPANALVDLAGDRPIVRVADFGLARALADSRDGTVTRTGAVIGTPAYMSPEQRSGGPVDARSDVWALGVILLELACRRRPTFEEIEDPPAALGDPLRDHVRALLRRSPSERPADADAVLANLPPTVPVPPGVAAAWRALVPVPTPVHRIDRREAKPLAEHRLPPERDRFVGREPELEEIARRFAAGARLVTVVGAGGAGKTRLATRYASEWRDAWSSGTRFCDLSEATSLPGIAAAVARALEVPIGAGDPMTQLGHVLATLGRALVVLDNFEQIVGHAAETVGRWLDVAPDVRLLVTSRQVLHQRGEEVIEVGPLPATDAEALLLMRARTVRSGWGSAPEEAPVVRAIAGLLDGLPLAIELAAARAGLLAPEPMRARLASRFQLLAGVGSQPDRQRTLRATLDWSWGLLDPAEQQALAQLSVFEGGFTLDAAEAVLDLGGTWVLDAVQGLLDKSLVRRVLENRYDLLVSVREYAAEKLGPGTAAAQARHAATFAREGTIAALDRVEVPGGRSVRALAADLENLCAACRRATASGDGPVAACALAAAWEVLRMQGPVPRALALGAPILALPLADGERATVARILGVCARFCADGDRATRWLDEALTAARRHGEPRLLGLVLGSVGYDQVLRGGVRESHAALDEALEIARSLGDRKGEAGLMCTVGNLVSAVEGRSADAIPVFDRALALARETGDRRGEAMALHVRAISLHLLGRTEGLVDQMEEALAMHREVGNTRSAFSGMANLADLVCALSDDHEHARRTYEAALVGVRRAGDRRMEGYVLGALGLLLSERMHDYAGARASFEESIRVNEAIGMRQNVAINIANLAEVDQAEGKCDDALRRYAEALALHREIGDRRCEAIALQNIGTLHRSLGALDEAERHLLEAIAIHGEIDNVRFLAFACSHLGDVYLDRGDLATAAGAYDRAISASEACGDEPWLVRVLIRRGELALTQGHREPARALLSRAAALRESSRTSELGRRLAEALDQIEQASASSTPGADDA